MRALQHSISKPVSAGKIRETARCPYVDSIARQAAGKFTVGRLRRRRAKNSFILWVIIMNYAFGYDYRMGRRIEDIQIWTMLYRPGSRKR